MPTNEQTKPITDWVTSVADGLGDGLLGFLVQMDEIAREQTRKNEKFIEDYKVSLDQEWRRKAAVEEMRRKEEILRQNRRSGCMARTAFLALCIAAVVGASCYGTYLVAGAAKSIILGAGEGSENDPRVSLECDAQCDKQGCAGMELDSISSLHFISFESLYIIVSGSGPPQWWGQSYREYLLN